MPPLSKTEQASEIARIAAAAAAAVIANDISHIQKDLADIKLSLEKHYLTKVEFEPVRKIVYGLVAAILMAVIGGLLTLVITHAP